MTASVARRLHVYMLETRYEILKQCRVPASLLFSLGFPVMFYTLFSVMFGRRSGDADGIPFGAYYLATYGAFSVAQATLFGFGVGVANERAQGWLTLKRASPMPLEAYFLAKLLASLVFAAAVVAALTLCGVAVVGLRLPFPVFARLGVTLMAGAVPFCALGLAIAYWAGPNTAPAAVNLINMPMSIASGLWIPLTVMPPLFRHIAVWLPPYHFGQLALAAIGQGGDVSLAQHVAVLVAFAVGCLALARAGYRRREEESYG